MTTQEALDILTCQTCGKLLTLFSSHEGGKGNVWSYQCPAWIIDGEEGHTHLPSTERTREALTVLIVEKKARVAA
jgi:hypothetical protein